MTRRGLTGAVCALALVASACGLGDKQAQADRIIDEGKRLMQQESIAATVAVRVHVVPVDRELVVQEPPRIAEGSLTDLAAVLHPLANTASVADSVLFVRSAMYERIASNTVAVGSAAAAIVPSNLNAIFASVRGRQLLTTAVSAEPAPTTTTTAPTRTLRRSVQIVREWAAFDFADIPDHERTKHGGSLGINPVAILRLTTGVLPGSIERVGPNVFKANVSRDKAERKLSEDEREVLGKMFTANAVTRTVFPAVFRFSPDGRLAAFEVRLRQTLSSKDRADMTYRFALQPGGESHAEALKPPPRRGTVTLSSLGQLVTTVSGL